MVHLESNQLFQLPMLACICIWSIYGSPTKQLYMSNEETQQEAAITNASIYTERKRDDALMPSNKTNSTLRINHPHPLTVKLMFLAEAHQKTLVNTAKILPTISINPDLNGTIKRAQKDSSSSQSSYGTESVLMRLLRPPPNITKDDWPKIQYKPIVTSTVENITSNETLRRSASEFLNYRHQLPSLSSSVKRSVTSSQIPLQGMLRNVGAGNSRATSEKQRHSNMPSNNTHGSIVDMDPVRRMLALTSNNPQGHGSITPLARILSNVDRQRESINRGSTTTNASLPLESFLYLNYKKRKSTKQHQHHNINTDSINRPLFPSRSFESYNTRTGLSTIKATTRGNEEINHTNEAPDHRGRAVHLVSADNTTSKDNPFNLASKYAQRSEFARAHLMKNVRNSTVEQSVQISIDNPGHHTLQELYAKQMGNPVPLNHGLINQHIHHSTYGNTSNPEYTKHSNTTRTFFYIPQSQSQRYEPNKPTGTPLDRDHAHVASYTLNMNRTQQQKMSSSSSTNLDKANVTSYTVPIHSLESITVNQTKTQNTYQENFTMPIYHTIRLFKVNKEGVNSRNMHENRQVGSSTKPDFPTNRAFPKNITTGAHTNDKNTSTNSAFLVGDRNRAPIHPTLEDSQQGSVTYPQTDQRGVQRIQSESILQTQNSARISDLSPRMTAYEHEHVIDHIPISNSTRNLSNNHGMEEVSGYETHQKEVIHSGDVLDTLRDKGTTNFQTTISTTPSTLDNLRYITRDQMSYRRGPESHSTILKPNSHPTSPANDQMSHRLSGSNIMTAKALLDSLRQSHPDSVRPSDLQSVRPSHLDTNSQSQSDSLRPYNLDTVNQSRLESLTQSHIELGQSYPNSLRSSSLDSVPQPHMDSVTESHLGSAVLGPSRLDSLRSFHQDSVSQLHLDSIKQSYQDSVGLGSPNPDSSHPSHLDSASHSQSDSVRPLNTDSVGLGTLHPDPLLPSHLDSVKLGPSYSDSLSPSNIDSMGLGSINSDSLRSPQLDLVSQPHQDSVRQSHHDSVTQPLLDSVRPSHFDPVRLSNLDSLGQSHQDMVQSSLLGLSSLDSVQPHTTNHQQPHESQYHQHSQSKYDQFLSSVLDGPYSNIQTNMSVISDATPATRTSNQEQVIYSQVRGGRTRSRISGFQIAHPSADIIGNSNRRVASTYRHQGTPENNQHIFSGHHQPLLPVTADMPRKNHGLVDPVFSDQYLRSRHPTAELHHRISSLQRPIPGRSISRQGTPISVAPTIPSNITQLIGDFVSVIPVAENFSNNVGPAIQQPYSEPVSSVRDDSMLDFLSWLVDAANVHYNLSTATSTEPPNSGQNHSQPSPLSSRTVSSQLNKSTLSLLKFIAEYNSSSTTGSETAPIAYQNTGQQPAPLGESGMSDPSNRNSIQFSVASSTTQQPPTNQAYASTTPNPQVTIQRLIATLQRAVAKQKSVASSQVTVPANHTLDELVVKAVNSIVRIQALKSLDCRAVSFLYSISFMEYLPMRCDNSCPALTKCMNVGSIGFCCPIFVTNHMIQLEIMKATTSADNDMLSV